MRGSVLSLALTSKVSLPLLSDLVPTNEIQDWAEDSTSTLNSVLYWMSTVTVPPSAGIFDTLPTWMVVLADCFRATLAVSPSLWNETLPVVSSEELAAEAVTVTEPTPSPEAGEILNPEPLTLAVHA